MLLDFLEDHCVIVMRYISLYFGGNFCLSHVSVSNIDLLEVTQKHFLFHISEELEYY